MNKEIKNIWQAQKTFFQNDKTKDYHFRINMLKKLKSLLAEYEEDIFKALKKDLGRTDYETFIAENVVIYDELKSAIKNLKKWMKPQKVSTPIQLQFAKSKIHSEPLGQILIIAPWNYPFHLSLAPLVGAICAGNCVIIKPSEIAKNASKVLAKLINDNFQKEYIHVIEGDKETVNDLLELKHNLVFFTGGATVGKIIYQKAAKFLTPVILELGGKCPCIVHKDAQIDVAVKRIIWGKFLNSGQTCLAPDYLLIHNDIKEEFTEKLKKTLISFYGKNPLKSKFLSKIVNKKHFNRLSALMKEGNVVFGGEHNEELLKISPTILDRINVDSKIMQDEIFGPILPIIYYSDINETIDIINNIPKALSLYLFTKDKNIKEFIINNTSSGSIGINDCLMQAANGNMPFGGVGESGIGSYHHKYSFNTFSHQKSIMDKKTWFDPSIRYLPYKKENLKILKKFTT
ncbi:MAG: aldehyde dehydrogenase [Methanosarcinales archaeon]|nr:aldehyde dehydrogenase [Methanosarcinales archaeon]